MMMYHSRWHYVLVVHHVRVKYQIHVSMKIQQQDSREESASQQPHLQEV